MNILRFIVNSNSDLVRPVKDEDIPNKHEESEIMRVYENKIVELEAKIREQEVIINELKQLLYNNSMNINT